jgi:hypothetical protein
MNSLRTKRLLQNHRHPHNKSLEHTAITMIVSGRIVLAQYWRPGSDSGRVLSSMLDGHSQ